MQNVDTVRADLHQGRTVIMTSTLSYITFFSQILLHRQTSPFFFFQQCLCYLLLVLEVIVNFSYLGNTNFLPWHNSSSNVTRLIFHGSCHINTVSPPPLPFWQCLYFIASLGNAVQPSLAKECRLSAQHNAASDIFLSFFYLQKSQKQSPHFLGNVCKLCCNLCVYCKLHKAFSVLGMVKYQHCIAPRLTYLVPSVLGHKQSPFFFTMVFTPLEAL